MAARKDSLVAQNLEESGRRTIIFDGVFEGATRSPTRCRARRTLTRKWLPGLRARSRQRAGEGVEMRFCRSRFVLPP